MGRGCRDDTAFVSGAPAAWGQETCAARQNEWTIAQVGPTFIPIADNVKAQCTKFPFRVNGLRPCSRRRRGATSPTATSVCSRERPLTGKFRGDPERQELAGQRPSGLNTRGFVVEGRSTTPSRRWHFSGRAPGPLRKRSFASQAEKSPPGDGSRSRVASTARYKHAAERLHLKAANRRCRPGLDLLPMRERSFSAVDLAATRRRKQ